MNTHGTDKNRGTGGEWSGGRSNFQGVSCNRNRGLPEEELQGGLHSDRDWKGSRHRVDTRQSGPAEPHREEAGRPEEGDPRGGKAAHLLLHRPEEVEEEDHRCQDGVRFLGSHRVFMTAMT